MQLALDLFSTANKAGAAEEWLAAALPSIATELGADYAAVAAGDVGRWNVLAASGPARPLPAELLAETLDRDALQVRGEWAAGPIAPPGQRPEALVLHWARASSPEIASAVGACCPSCARP